jgi:hypothetical protein
VFSLAAGSSLIFNGWLANEIHANQAFNYWLSNQHVSFRHRDRSLTRLLHGFHGRTQGDLSINKGRLS